MFPETIDSEQSVLLEKLSGLYIPIKEFYLAGGTALALQIGHRKSYDLDFFIDRDFNENEIASYISNDLSGEIVSTGENTVYGLIDNVKISFISFKYKLIKDFIHYSKIKLASFEDIACMKCSAIALRSEKKDFFDLYEILKRLQPMELRNMLTEKFQTNGFNPYYMAKTFFFFDEVEKSPEPISLNGTTWEKVKSFLISNEKKILKAFS